MVVVSGGWVKNVVTFPTNGDLITAKMAARAVLICRPNSHPFQERTLILDQPVKIGRSLARARAVQNNAIFDCKVLSRNHALLWYEKGKFYLQDTKSSNGTFVNNQRLSKGAEESQPREVCSGDIVQFGVDVMENARKVTHGCIVAKLNLYLPDGKEAKASPSTSVVSSVGTVSLEDLYQLNQYLQEALQREQMLENKLVTLQHLVDSTRQASELGWKALIDEDRLLSRVEVLESQLQVSSKNFAEDKLREELRKLQEDKCTYQGTAKDSLQKILQEKLDAIHKLQALEQSVSNTENECAHLKKLCERSQLDLQELAQKYSLQLVKVQELQSELQLNDEQHRDNCLRLELEKRELQIRMEEQIESERALQARLDELELDGDLTQQKLLSLQSHLTLIGKNEENEGDTNIELDNMKVADSSEMQVGIILERIDTSTTPVMDDNTKEEVEGLRHQLKKYEEELQESVTLVNLLHLQLEGVRKEEDSSHEKIVNLQEKIDDTEVELSIIQSESENNKNNDSVMSHNNSSPNQINKLKLELAKYEELLAAERTKKRTSETQKAQYQLELDCTNSKVKQCTEEANLVKQRLQVAQCQMSAKSEKVEELERLLETSAQDVKVQLSQMNDKVKEEHARGNKYASEAEQLRKQLMDAQQDAKQSHNEAEQMKDRLKAVQTELEVVRRAMSNTMESGDNKNREAVTLLEEQYISLQDENERLRSNCAHMEEQILAMEEKANLLREAYAHSNVMQLRLDLQATALASRNTAINDMGAYTQTDHVDGEMGELNITTLEEELVVVKQEFTRCNEDKSQLASELKVLREEFGALSSQSYAVPVHYLIAMVLAVVAILMAINYVF